MKHVFVFLLSSLILVLVQAIPWNYIFPQVIQLNLSFVLVIFLALYHPSPSGWFIAFLLGYMLEALSGIPPGLLPLANLIAFFLIRVARMFVLFESLLSQAILVFALSFSADLSLLTITKIVFAYPCSLILKNLLANSLLLMALGMPLFAILNKRVYSQGLVLK